MDPRLLETARRALAARLDPPPLVIGALTPSETCLVLTLEWPLPAGRARLVIDTDARHSTLHLLGGSRASEGERSRFADPLVGRHLTLVFPGPDELILALDFSPAARGSQAAPLRLFAEWTGRRGNLRLVDDRGLVLATLRRAGVPPGEPYAPPQRAGAAPLDAPPVGPPDPPADDALHAQLRRTYEADLQRALAEDRRAGQLRAIRREVKRLLRLRAHLEEERGDPQRGLRLRRSGEAILSLLHAIRKGAPEVTAAGWAPDGGDLVIALDPARSAVENAEEYFRRARRWDRGEPHRRRRLEEIDRAVARLSVLETRVAEAERPPGAEAFPAKLDEALGIFRRTRQAETGATPTSAERSRSTSSRGPTPTGPSARRGPEGAPVRGRERPAHAAPAFHPRSFTTSEGWTVLVGRSNAENDWLTHRHARPEDLWFHAHGVPGSHVVLRREGRKSNPSSRTLEEAAAIAAFYSKARHSSKTPVIYTLRKHVRKPRGAKPGLAVCEREKMIMVRPKDPTEGREPEWMED